jgi:hypothetical protein
LTPAVAGVDFLSGYKHAINWIPDSFVVDATTALTTAAFSLGSVAIVNTTAPGAVTPKTTLPLSLRAVSSWGVPDHFVYANYDPNVPGAANALFFQLIAFGWTDLYSYSGSDANSFVDGVIGNSFIVDTTPGSYSIQDAQLGPGDAWVYGPWFSPASGQNASNPQAGLANGIANTTSLFLFENRGAPASLASVSLRTATIDAATGERPEGRGCDATGCAAPARPVQVSVARFS